MSLFFFNQIDNLLSLKLRQVMSVVALGSFLLAEFFFNNQIIYAFTKSKRMTICLYKEIHDAEID